MGYIYNFNNGDREELISISQFEYESLSYEQKHDPNKYYYISDDVPVTNTITKEVEMLPKTCHRCGAPLHNEKCEYCGTEYGHIYI